MQDCFCKKTSLKTPQVTAVLPLFPYSRQSDIPYNKAGAPLQKASNYYNQPNFSFESKPQTPHPDTSPTVGLPNGVNALHEGLARAQIDDTIPSPEKLQRIPSRNRAQEHSKVSNAMDSPRSDLSTRHYNALTSSGAYRTSQEDDTSISPSSSKNTSFHPRPGYKQWVAQAGTLVADLL
ncbi:ribose-phosphate pyrophosphokinase [Mycoblastus sanguinarius]|nr:ribose-phosphate pyrophosphokinase [Mycoblastus sanguinarius]